MSIDLQANTSVASRGSGLGTTSGNGTAVVWYRKSSSAAAGDLILELGMSGSTLRFSVGASDAVDYETGGGAQTPDNAATHADGTWGYYAIVVSGGAWAAYWYDDTGARTTIRASAWTGASTPNYVAIGDTNTSFGTGAQGQYRYLRMWNAALSDADLEAEFAATSAVRTSDLRGDWPLADSTDDSDSSGNGNTLTLSGTIGTSSEEPPIGQVETGTSGGLVVGSETSYVGEGFVGSIEAAGSISSAISLTLTPSGTLTGTGAVSAAVSLTLTPSGALAGLGALASDIPLVVSLGGTLENAGSDQLTGSVGVTLILSATLTGQGALSSAIPITLAPSATLTGTGALASAVPLTVSAASVLTGTGQLVTTMPLALTPSGTLGTVGSGALTSTVGLSLAITATLAGSGALTGTVPLTIAATGTMRNGAPYDLVGAIGLTLGTQGALTGRGALTSAVPLVVSLTADIAVQITGAHPDRIVDVTRDSRTVRVARTARGIDVTRDSRLIN